MTPPFTVVKFPDSTSIRKASYDPMAKKMRVQWAGGRVYEYDNISKKIVTGLCTASSAGHYLNRYVTRYPDRYPYRIIEEIEE